MRDEKGLRNSGVKKESAHAKGAKDAEDVSTLCQMSK